MNFTQAHNDYLDPEIHDGPAHLKRKQTYQVSWDNGHACGVFPEVFESKTAAVAFAKDWKSYMVTLEPNNTAEARRAYQWEVIPNES